MSKITGFRRDVEELARLRDFVRAKAKEFRAEGTRAGELAFHRAERACHDLTDALRRLRTPTSH
jgi:hypothetical protein